MRRLLAALTCLAVLAGAARAQDPVDPYLDVAVEPAFGLESVPPGWMPIRVTARNRRTEAGSPESFVFKITSRMFYRGGEVIASREEAIPLGATKRFWMYTFVDEASHPVVDAEVAGSGRRAAKRPSVKPPEVRDPGVHYSYSGQSSEPFRIGVVSGKNAGVLNVTKGLTLPNRIKAEPVALDIDLLPDRRVGYGPLDLLVINDANLSALSPEQSDALRTWVLGGGRLLVSPGIDASWLTHPFFRDLLPPGKPRAAETTIGGRAVQVTVYDAPGAIAPPPSRTANAFDGLVSRWRAGHGEVAVLAVDVSNAAVRDLSEAQRAAFWEAVFRPWRPRAQLQSGARWAVSVPSRQGPQPHDLLVPPYEAPAMTIAILALVYVVVIGPLNFMVLRRLGREPLLVLTVPGIAVLSVASIFAAGYVAHGASEVGYEVTTVFVRSAERWAVAERLLAVVPARAVPIAVRFGRDEAGIAVGNEPGDPAMRGFRIEHRDRLEVRNLNAARFEPGIVRAESVVDLEGTVKVTDRPGGIEVVNEMRRPLANVLAQRGGDRFYAARIAAGETAVLERVTTEVVFAPNPRSPGALHLGSFDSDGMSSLTGRAGRRIIETAAQRGVRFAALIEPDPPAEGTSPVARERACILVVEQ